MRKEIVTLTCVLGLLSAATGAFAGSYGAPEQAEEMAAPAPAAREAVVVEETDYAKVGPYIGIGGNYAIENFDSGTVGNSGGMHVRAGYRVHPNFSVEGLYTWYKEFDTDPWGDYTGYALSVNGKGYLLTGRFQPYLLVGLGYIDINQHSKGGPGVMPGNAPHGDEGFMMRFGGGLEGCITENISMGPEVAYVLPIGNGIDNFGFTEVALGLRYKF